MTSVAIIDYGMGNLRSVAKAIEHVAPGHDVFVTSDPAHVAAAERVVFPGQGAMPDCMRELDARGLRPAVLAAAASKPFLGICIGEQMLFAHSEEGDAAGLGIFPGSVQRFPAANMHGADGSRLKVPHMGWNSLILKTPSPLLTKAADGYVYFVHSFHAVPEDKGIITAVCNYGTEVTAAVGRGNVQAVQFHPEKSSKVGLGILQAFKEWQL